MRTKGADEIAVFETEEEIGKAVVRKIIDLENGKEGNLIGVDAAGAT